MRIPPLVSSGSAGEPHVFLRGRSVTSRALLLGLPALAAVLLLMFLAVGAGTARLADNAATRIARLRAQSMSLALEHAMDEARSQLLTLAQGSLNAADMAARLSIRARAGEGRFRELAFEGLHPGSRYLLINLDGEVVHVPLRQALDSPASPFRTLAGEPRPGLVTVGQPLEVSYSMLTVGGVLRNAAFSVLRFSTAVRDNAGGLAGYLTLSMDLRELRNILSAYAASGADQDAQAEEDGNSGDVAFFFDRDGWMLFQSEPVGDSRGLEDLSTDTVRSGLVGSFGRPGFNAAFRPGSEHRAYWDMVVDVQNGRDGNLPVYAQGAGGGNPQGDLAGYAPVVFRQQGQGPPVVVGGLAVLHAGFMTSRAGLQFMLACVAAFAGGLLPIGLILWWLGRQMAAPLGVLGAELERRNAEGGVAPLDLSPLPRELERLKRGVNEVLRRLRQAQDIRRQRQEEADVQMRRAPFTLLPRPEGMPADGLIGASRPMRALYESIRKAAHVDDDVLIVGETGTGKELISEAIHRQSARASGPFITINCGALDENLLMDTLFGHVKGAFTEARAARKGAFLAASGGTLMLDEVGNAAPKVQQALLRALSTRRIRPLGSDQDTPFDTRIIAATNASLLDDAHRGSFREDLYYRLAVITIHSAPLRERKSDIPALCAFFLRAAFMARPPRSAGSAEPAMPRLSRGALDKLLAYDWPGNVRELKNALIRSLAFCEGDILYEEDIRLGASLSAGEPSLAAPPAPVPRAPAWGAAVPHGWRARSAPAGGEDARARPSTAGPGSGASPTAAPKAAPPVPPAPDVAAGSAPPPAPGAPALPPRLAALWPAIVGKGAINRQEYQEMAGNISARTAQYDLRLLAQRGLVRKAGRGPAQRYVVLSGGA